MFDFRRRNTSDMGCFCRDASTVIETNFAKSIVENRNMDFWSEVRKIKYSTKGVSSSVDGMTDSSEIADMFADKYDELYSSVPYDSIAMDAIAMCINSGIDVFNSVVL